MARRKIAAEAADRAAASGAWGWPLPVFRVRHIPAFATAFAAVLIVVAGLPFAFRHQGGQAGRGDDAMRIEVITDGDAVKLAWTDGDRQSYTVTKISDPRAADRQEAHLVRGNVWIDTDPESSTVVFYKIE